MVLYKCKGKGITNEWVELFEREKLMAFTKDKNIIKYKGRMYEITCDTNTGELTTNHPDGRNFINRTCRGRGESYAEYMLLVNNGVYHRFLETILLQKEDLLHEMTCLREVTDIQEIIELAQKNWKETQEMDFRNTSWSLLSVMRLMGLDLNALEKYWYRVCCNVKFTKTFAGQLEMYKNYLSLGMLETTLKEAKRYKVDVDSMIKNKNLLQTLKEIQVETERVKNKFIIDGLSQVYQQYSFIEEMGKADGWKFQVLKDVEDFKYWGEKMNNCLFRMSYHKAVAERKCLVVIAENPDGKYISIELTRYNGGDYVMRQSYYKSNRHIALEDSDYLKSWVDGITKYVKKLEEK